MLEKSVLIPDYLINSTSGPFVVLAVSMLITAALLLILDPLETLRTYSRTRKYGIAVAFFVLALSASASFAGQIKGPIPSLNALQRCEAEASKTTYYPVISTPCAYDRPKCPETKNGGNCEESAFFKYKSTAASTAIYTQVSGIVTYSYCPDSAPSWNGSACVAQDPCATMGGLAVDDGSVGPDNTKLSMSFPRREDDNYVGQTFCSGGCKAAVDKEVGSSGGYFDGKYVGQFSAKFSGQSCAPAAPQVTPKTTPALIPKTSAEYDCVSKGMGYGYVNETVKCVTPSETKATTKGTSETTKPDGSKTKISTTEKTQCLAGVCYTTTTTITTEYNSSGTVTGTSQKQDTTEKPDPNSGLGTGGAGAGTGKEGMACGGPGQPVCAVKVDETGVEKDVTAVEQSAQAKFSAIYDQVHQKMEEVTRPKVWGVSWNYVVPSGACSSLQFGAGRFVTALDICKPLGYVRDLWSYVMYVLTGLYIWRSARDAMNII